MPFPKIDTDLIDTGTGANQVVKLDNNAKLPALDASQLINLPGGLGGGLVLLQAQTANASTSIAFTSTYLTTAYKHFIITYSGVSGTIPPANFLYLTTSTNNGASYSTSGYVWSGYYQNPGDSTLSGQSANNASRVDLTINSGNFSDSPNTPASGIINLFDITSAIQQPTFMMQYNDYAFIVNGGGKLPSGNINNIKIAPASGTFSGTFKLYGVS